MESTPSPIPLGFHYFTDMEHYRLQDALDFIPLIKSVRGTFLFFTCLFQHCYPRILSLRMDCREHSTHYPFENPYRKCFPKP